MFRAKVAATLSRAARRSCKLRLIEPRTGLQCRPVVQPTKFVRDTRFNDVQGGGEHPQGQRPSAETDGNVHYIYSLIVCSSLAMFCSSCGVPMFCSSPSEGLIWKCPHCNAMQIRKGSPASLPYCGEGRGCTNKNCKKFDRVPCVWIWRFGAKQTDTRVRFGAAAVTVGSVVVSFLFPPAAPVAAKFAIGAAMSGGAYNIGMGIGSQDGWRCVRGVFAFLGAGLDCAGDAAADMIGHGLDALEVVVNITQALIEGDPVQGGLAVFSAIAVAGDLNVKAMESRDIKSAKDAEKVFREAKENTSKLARSIRAGGPQPGVKIGDEVIKSLRKASDTTKGLEVLLKAKKITAEEAKRLHELSETLKECCGFTGDIADFMETLSKLKATVHVEKR